MARLSVNRFFLVKLVVSLWVIKGAMLYMLWTDRNFSSGSINDGDLNLGTGAHILTAISFLFFGTQILVVFAWWRQALVRMVNVPVLFWAVMVFTVASLLGSAFAHVGNFWTYWSLFALPFVYVASLESPELIAKHAVRCFGYLILCSIPFLIVFPDRALWFSDEEQVLAFAPRFAGLSPHANVMGVIAAFVAILSMHLFRGLDRAFWMTIGIVALVASQSKTAAVAAAITMLVGVVGKTLGSSYERMWQLGVCITLGALSLASAWWLPVVSSGIGDWRVSTLTGRTDIWDASLQMWSNSPVFGKGVDAFDAYFRQVTQLTGAESAHNQALDTMVSSGTVGLVALIALIVACIARLSQLHDNRRRELVVGIMVFMLVRFMTEATLKFNGPGITYVVFFVLMVALLAREDRSLLESPK